MFRTLTLSILAGLLISQYAMGQSPEGAPGEPAKVESAAPNRPPARPLHGMDPTGMLDALTTELQLDETQRQQALSLLTDYRTKQIEVRKSLRPQPEASDRTRQLLSEMRAAQQAGDKDKIKQLSDELRAIRETQNAQIAPMRQQLQDLQDTLHTDLKGILRPDQHEKFESIWEERMVRRGSVRGRMRSPQALRTLVEKLPDVTGEQKQQIDALFKANMEAVREAGSNHVAKEKANAKLYDDVLAALTPEQRDTVNKQLEGRGRPPRKSDQPEGQPGGEPAPPPPPGGQ